MKSSNGRWSESRVDIRTLRSVFGRFPTGVTIVSTMSGDVPVGLTVNSYTSISLDPPLILWALADNSINLNAFKRCDHFGVSFLSGDQEDVARRFASFPSDGRFDSTEFYRSPQGTPLLHRSIATLECENYAHWHLGDHALVVGRVTGFQERAGHPLIFHCGVMSALS